MPNNGQFHKCRNKITKFMSRIVWRKDL